MSVFYEPTLLIGAAWTTYSMGSGHRCCRFRDSLAEELRCQAAFALFYVAAIVLFLPVIFPPVFSHCFSGDSALSACRAPQITASLLLAANLVKGF